MIFESFFDKALSEIEIINGSKFKYDVVKLQEGMGGTKKHTNIVCGKPLELVLFQVFHKVFQKNDKKPIHVHFQHVRIVGF